MNDQLPTAVFESGASTEVAPLTSGMVLAGRYRVVSLIGSGGMGEVYRADDLKLGQPVALKFLARHVAASPRYVEQLMSEVRLGRSVSHPNVCRIHDVGELDGRPFLSMEYIDGEDLASLLRRVGRLPVERALYLAAQMLAGLTAAHDRGIVHRDLKPANVMIDGRGIAHLTDFGLAVGENTAGARVAGTPPYMAPEQFEGERLGRRTDVYAMGLILYEMITGRRVFPAATFEEIARAHAIPKTRASLFVNEIAPHVDDAIMRCIEEDPSDRPQDARSVAEALGVPDLLAATVAAGDTPEPALVAAAEHAPPLSRRTAAFLLAASVIGLFGIAAVYDQASFLGQVGVPLSPEVLRERARAIVGRAGYEPRPADFAYGLQVSPDAVRDAPDWETVRRHPAVVLFWYRQSPRQLVARNAAGIVDGPDPPHTVPGMVVLTLDRNGGLRSFRAIPPRSSASRARPIEVDWSPWFESSGLPFERFRAVASVRTPPDAFDRRLAWFGTIGDGQGTPVRVEAASFDGKAVWFAVLNEWADGSAERPPSEWWRLSQWSYALLYVAVNVFAVVLARRHIRRGRADYRGALKVAGFIACVRLTEGLIAASHVPNLTAEWRIVMHHLAMALFFGTQLGLAYLAVEPYVRKQWPELLVTFMRMLRGRVRDPIVGRDLLIGFSAGVFVVLAGAAVVLTAELAGLGPSLSTVPSIRVLSSPRWIIAGVISVQRVALLFAFGLILALFLTWLAVRRRSVATVIVVTAIALIFTDWSSDHLATAITISMAATSLFAWLLLRFGLLALATCYAVSMSLTKLPLTLNWSDAWYVEQTVTAFAFLTVAAVAAFAAAIHPTALRRPVDSLRPA